MLPGIQRRDFFLDTDLLEKYKLEMHLLLLAEIKSVAKAWLRTTNLVALNCLLTKLHWLNKLEKLNYCINNNP